MSNSLYVLTNEFLDILNQLEDMDLDHDTLNDTLDSLRAPLEEKTENVVKYIRHLESLATAKKEEAKRLQESAAGDLKKAERLKVYLDENLKRAGLKELQAGIFQLKYKKGSEIVEIDESLLPKDYWIPQPPKPESKTELKKMIKNGMEIPGVSVIRKPESLVIK